MKREKMKSPAVACRAQELIYTNRIITHYCIIVKSNSTENYVNIIGEEVKND